MTLGALHSLLSVSAAVGDVNAAKRGAVVKRLARRRKAPEQSWEQAIAAACAEPSPTRTRCERAKHLLRVRRLERWRSRSKAIAHLCANAGPAAAVEHSGEQATESATAGAWGGRS